jgi:hypothetical protein
MARPEVHIDLGSAGSERQATNRVNGRVMLQDEGVCTCVRVQIQWRATSSQTVQDHVGTRRRSLNLQWDRSIVDRTRRELCSRSNWLLDFGCFHTLPRDLRPADVGSVSAVASPGATLLVYGFARPPMYAPIQAGVGLAEIRERFGTGWELESAERTTANRIQVARTGVDRSFELWRFRLVRRS